MKIRFHLLAFALFNALFLGSCSSDPTVEEDLQTGIPVTFNVSTLNVDVKPMALSRASTASGAAVGDVVNTIGYYLYSDGKLHREKLDSFDPALGTAPETFGKYGEIMLPGQYLSIFYAYGKGKGTASVEGDKSTFNSEITINATDKEVFTSTGAIEVNANTQNVDITLQRKSALLVIDILDEAIPEAAKVEYKYRCPTGWKVMYEDYDMFDTFVVNPEIKEKKLARFETYILCFKNTTVTLDISIFDKAGALLGKKTVYVPIEVNRRSIVSGNLFTTLGQKDFNIQIDDNWGEDIQVPIE